MNTNYNEARLTANTQLCDSATVRAVFGNKSDMWVWRRLKDGTLPPPIIISGRRYWRQDEIEALIARLSNTRNSSLVEAA